jgi:bifunctional non-homologous end joining protein LigD
MHSISVFFAFDLLHRDDDDLRQLPLAERRQRLIRLVSRSEIMCLHLVQAFDDGQKLLEEAQRVGLGGIISKRRAAAYKSGPSRDWIKVKNR